MLVGAQVKGQGPTGWTLKESLDELEQLARTDGIEVVGRVHQNLAKARPATYIGRGKVEEIASLRDGLQYDIVIFDDELSAGQLRNLEERLGVKVLDRTALILDIFAQHASTREGRLQVELAQYEYRLPRLTRAWTHLARQAGGATGRGGTGGVGLRGPGETQLEVDRREIGRRIARLKRELEEVRRQRGEHRQQRRSNRMPVVAIVGYTNAGKSSLLNAVAKADVLVGDKLFATLDPTTRRVALPKGREVLFSDTVGFIHKLPTTLVAAFRATLEEITEADLLVHVVDITHPHARLQAETVMEVLGELGAADHPVVTALNKVDLLPDDGPAKVLALEHPGAVPISAICGTGIPDLLERVDGVLAEEWTRVVVQLPYSEGDLVTLFHRRGLVESEAHRASGTVVTGRLPTWLLSRFRQYVR